MKKIAIIIISLFLLLSAGNFGTSEPVQNIDSTLETDSFIKNSITDKVQEQQILQNINRLDGFFTENRGQIGNDSVRYYIQGKGVWFLDDGVVFEIKESIKENEVLRDSIDRFQPEHEPEIPQPRKSVVLYLNFERCNEVEPTGINKLPHRSNFFYGNDSSKWCTNVPNFQEVIYENIYDDIDLRYYSSEQGLKYDFIVRPGGDPNVINLNYKGSKDISIDSNGDLVLYTPLGIFVDSELFVYQNVNGNKMKIESYFTLLDSFSYGFKFAKKYDPNKPIVIDPLIYSTFIGGGNDDEGYDIAIDSNGNAFVTGKPAPWFPTTPGAFQTSGGGSADAFVFKLNSNGSSLIYSTYIGGSQWDVGSGIAVDYNGNAFITGHTHSTDFPTTPNVHDSTNHGNTDAFVLKLNSTGSDLIYSTFLGSNDYECGNSLTIDLYGNAYVTGRTKSTNFPTTPLANDTSHNGDMDVFVTKLNWNGSKLIYSTFVGGSLWDESWDIAIDTLGNAYVTGYTYSTNFTTTLNANDTTHNGNRDAFVFKLNSTGALLLYSTFLGGSGRDEGYGIIIDSNSNACICGITVSTDFPITSNALKNTTNAYSEAFISKLNQIGSILLYSTYIGGSHHDESTDITLDDVDNIYITGTTSSSDFPVTPDAYKPNQQGKEIFVLKINTTNSMLLYSTFIYYGGNHIASGIEIDLFDNIYLTGYTDNSNFPTTIGAYDTTHGGMADVFVLKLSILLNNPPVVSNLSVSENSIFRTSSIYLFSNGKDIYDIEINLTPHFEYRDPNEQVWNKTYFSIPQYQNSRWEEDFTPPQNATLGLYDFRVRFNDTGGLFSNWFYLNDSLTVLNNIPEIVDITLSNNSALLDDSILLGINATDIEEIEQNLTIELEYRDPSETSWDKTNLNAPSYNNERWESSFNIPFDALFGYYDFRARCNDSDGNYSTWLYLNDSLLVYNAGPKVIDAGLSETSIYRTESVSIYINGTDYETPEDMLSLYVQYKPQSEDEWTNLTSNYLNNRYEVSLITYTDSILGNYDFRVKFEDNESVSSGWEYINDSLEVLNNLPTISDTLDDISVGIQPLLFDLTSFESDIEDIGFNLIWSITPQIYTYIESIGIIDAVNDTLKITPKENVTGTEDIELTLTDKDSGIAVKSDITIIVDSTISEFTPKVTLLSPVDKTVINTLTPNLKWELDYSGTDIITYTVTLDENPDPQTTIIAGLTSTEYTLENELVDGKTYYWKVEPTNGICLSSAFRFTIDLGFEPIYKVNLTSESTSVTIKQGVTKDINLTVTNEGNSVDNFEIELSSVQLQSQISVDKTNALLDPNIDSKVKLSIDIPDDFTIGDYTITVTATSLTDSIVKDEVTIVVKVVSKDFVPDYDVNISISLTSLELDQGDSENVTITISNNGNIEDDFNIRFESDDFTSTNIQFTDSSISIPEEDSDMVIVTITIPEDMTPGLYTIKFIVESNDDPQESTLTVTVKDKDGEEPRNKKDTEDNTMLYALVGIIIIIIVVLILLFIFLKKKKEKEEEAPVEEAEPPPPEEVPPEAPTPEQPPTTEIPPEQPPTPEVPPEVVPVPETPPTEQPQVPEVPPEQPPTPEVTPQVPQPQVEPAPQPTPQVEQPQVAVQEPQGQAPVPKIKTELTIEENDT